MSLFSNTYQVDPALTGRRVELVFDPFDMADITVNHHGTSFGKAIPHTMTRHSHPKARPETPHEAPVPTGIDYLHLVAAQHHAHAGAAINFQALSDVAFHTPAGAPPGTQPPDADPVTEPGQLSGQQPLPDMPPAPLPAAGHTP